MIELGGFSVEVASSWTHTIRLTNHSQVVCLLENVFMFPPKRVKKLYHSKDLDDFYNKGKETAKIEDHTQSIKESTQEKVIKKYKQNLEKRWFKPHSTRIQLIKALESNLNQAKSDEEIIDALIATGKSIREPDAKGKKKYGLGGYGNSTLYKHFQEGIRPENG